MDPEVARKRRERSKQRALKAQMLFSSNPDAKHLFNNADKTNDVSPIEKEQSLPNNQKEINDLLNNTPNNSENIEKQSESAKNNIVKEINIKANENEQEQENDQIKESSQTIDIEQTKEKNEVQENEQFKEIEKLKENGQIKENEPANKNKEVEKNEKLKEAENTIENERVQNVENFEYKVFQNELNHYVPQCKINNLDSQNAPDLIPKETNSPSIITALLSIRSIPFLIAPIFSYFSVPFGFSILVLMDIILFFITHEFEGLISMIKNIYEYVQEFSLRVTSLQCIILVVHILMFFLPSSLNEEI